MRKRQHIITVQNTGKWTISVDGCLYDSFRTRDQAMDRALLWARNAMQQEKSVLVMGPDRTGRIQPIWRDGLDVESHRGVELSLAVPAH